MPDPQLTLHTSNRVENLAKRLVEVSRREPLSRLLSQETVMTLNPGIARWLQFQIAQQAGVSFGWDFPLPGKLFSRVLSGFEPYFDSSGAFPEDLARWHLLEILQQLEDQPRFRDILRYCSADQGARRYSFANQMVRMYDEYLVYRPEEIISWEDKPDESRFDWQAELWRRLIRRLYPKTAQPRHIARLWSDLRHGRILELACEPARWPERLMVFGVSSLAPLYLDLLHQLSQYRPVHIFLLQPSDLYWADLKTRKQMGKIARQAARKSGRKLTNDPEDWLYETGNPLLPGFGKQGQMFLDQLIDKNPLQDDSGFVPPAEIQSQLACLQTDLFAIQDRDVEKGSAPFPSYDGTIQLHSCSSRRREIETIWDLIVKRLDDDAQLKTSDILVMAPDIQVYRSHIEAVFKSKRGTDLEIPYSIADNIAGRRPGVMSGLLAILQSVSSRASSADVMSLVESPLLREVFQFSDRDLESIEFWIRELGITWGWDSQHRSQHDGFATDRNTWKEMRSRLIAGAFFADDTKSPSGFLAFSEIESGLADTAGRFVECLELLKDLRRNYSQTQSIRSWQDLFAGLIDRLQCDREEWQRDYQKAKELVVETLPDLDNAFATGAEACRALADKFDSSVSSGGYLNGGVTFCSLKPMRAIPADTVCLVGMNRLDFPRANRRPHFDLLAKEARIGDRNTRDEDRQFFLETILSVRSHLFLTYQGIASNSDSEKAPSTVVEELMAYLEKGMDPADYQKITSIQRRQSFDASYFEADETQTYDPDRAALRNRFASLLNKAAPLKSDPEREESPVDEVLEVSTLAQFFADPLKAFASTVAQLKFITSSDALSEADELLPDGLDRYKLRTLLAERLKLGESISEIDFEALAQSKTLPVGYLAQPTFAAEIENASEVAEIAGTSEMETRFIESRIGDIAVAGESTVRLMDGNALQISVGELKAKRVIYAWIQHLFTSAFDTRFSGETYLLTLHDKQKHLRFKKVENARELLAELVDLYRQGMQGPLPFIPEISEAAAKEWNKSSNSESEEAFAEALDKANTLIQDAVTPSEFSKRYTWSPYDRACLGDDYLPDERFVDHAVSIWSKVHAAVGSLDINELKGAAE
ncbi:exodeoxyribonuclease V subunit gamma [Pelagicoccus albus]|uniref:Exodeoxyribonuclease V subunit gamma n=1 Tax=Pelagicoccus albus TaxID=415222 RepID=A0A7X1EB91_9BACT|nr:exodeoxyribonuclease V subunit gamma [Pelagicoccus albus]MBC2607552.1 exodeoxyribonuclease V subunit gamma [Pelagicoccus albus]